MTVVTAVTFDLRTLAKGTIAIILFFVCWTLYDRYGAAQETAVRDAWKLVNASRRRFHDERARADSLELTARRALRGADGLRAGLARAESRTDAALARLDTTIAAARALAADSAAPADTLRRAIESLALRAEDFERKFQAERDTAAARSDRLTQAASALVTAIDAKNVALASADALDHQNATLEQALLRARPGLLRRGISGLVAGGSAILCGGGGWVLGGPLGAVGAAATCATVAGMLSP